MESPRVAVADPTDPSVSQQIKVGTYSYSSSSKESPLPDRRTHDTLTGTANYSSLLTAIDEAIGMTDPLNPDSMVLYIDLEGFREINTTFGQQTGNRLLIEVARRLIDTCPEGDVICRAFSDEFILLLENISMSHDRSYRLGRITQCFDEPFILGDQEISVNPSMGGAVITDREMTASKAINYAEEAMQQVRKYGQKGLFIADEKMIRELELRGRLDGMINDALQNNRFFLLYQPIIDLETGRACRAEALLRLRDKNGTVLQASEFITAIDQMHQQITVDKWVLTEFIHTIRMTHNELPDICEFRLSMNLSSGSLSSMGYADHFLSNLRLGGISPNSISLEIREAQQLAHNPVPLENLAALSHAGAELIMDHFGNKNINLRELHSLSLRSVKIDGSFLNRLLLDHPKEKQILLSLIAIAKILDYRIIAEGIEEKSVADDLLSLGCESAQGYFYAKPMPMGDLILFVKALNAEIEKKSGAMKTDFGRSSFTA